MLLSLRHPTVLPRGWDGRAPANLSPHIPREGQELGFPRTLGILKLWGQADRYTQLCQPGGKGCAWWYQGRCRRTHTAATLPYTQAQEKVVAEKMQKQLKALRIHPHSLGNHVLRLRGSPGPAAPQ